jgi:hypothetical protein
VYNLSSPSAPEAEVSTQLNTADPEFLSIWYAFMLDA